jgi:hypothetical protein
MRRDKTHRNWTEAHEQVPFSVVVSIIFLKYLISALSFSVKITCIGHKNVVESSEGDINTISGNKSLCYFVEMRVNPFAKPPEYSALYFVARLETLVEVYRPLY